MKNANYYKEILKNNTDYNFEPVSAELKFTYQSSKYYMLRKLRKKYNLDKIAGCTNEFKQMVNLMAWVSDALMNNGEIIYSTFTFNALDIIERTKEKGISSNCWMYSTVLNEIYLSMGFKSRRIRCMSEDINDNECHCVTIAYSNEYRKWVLFDAANKAIFVNRNALPMSLEELRNALINDESFILPKAKDTDYNKIKNYWYKNIVRFECYSYSSFNIEASKKDKVIFNLNPSTIKIADRETIKSGARVKYINISNPHFFWQG